MDMCVHIFTLISYIYIYIYIHAYIVICIYIYIYVYLFINLFIYLFIYLFMHVYKKCIAVSYMLVATWQPPQGTPLDSQRLPKTYHGPLRAAAGH